MSLTYYLIHYSQGDAPVIHIGFRNFTSVRDVADYMIAHPLDFDFVFESSGRDGCDFCKGDGCDFCKGSVCVIPTIDDLEKQLLDIGYENDISGWLCVPDSVLSRMLARTQECAPFILIKPSPQ